MEGSSSVAKRFHVPSIILGLTIVAMGTSLPEAAVSISASMQNANSLAISNAVGSNIFNMMVVIGVCAVLTPVAVQKQTLVKDFPFSLVVWLMAWTKRRLDKGEGLIMVLLYAAYVAYIIMRNYHVLGL